MIADIKEEQKLWKIGFKAVVGLDEAGRGPLAGPVVAAAVCLHKFSMSNKAKIVGLKLKDSKKLTPAARKSFYKIIKKSRELKWGIGIVSEKVIDKINILEATKLVMLKALSCLQRKIPKKKKIDFLILDGNFRINSKISQKSIVKGDEKVFSCAAASIIAKVTRDRIMVAYHKKYPKYRFDLHKGYPTKYHRKMLQKYGPCPIHRISFSDIRSIEIDI